MTFSLKNCVDYRSLNALTLKDTYPIPYIKSCSDTRGEIVYLSSFDMIVAILAAIN